MGVKISGLFNLCTRAPPLPPVKKCRLWPLFASAIFADKNKVHICDFLGIGKGGELRDRFPDGSQKTRGIFVATLRFGHRGWTALFGAP